MAALTPILARTLRLAGCAALVGWVWQPLEAAPELAWAEPVTVASGGWGRMIHLGKSDWLAVSTRFGKPNSNLQLFLSKDAARTWQPLGEVTEAGRLLDNGELIRLRDGVLLLTGRSLITDESYQLPVYRSSDGGRSWTRLSTIDANEGTPGSLRGRGLWEPHFYRLGDGRVAVAYANEKHAGEQPAYSQVCSVRISADGGMSWGQEIILAREPGGGALRPGMPVMARMADGRFMAVYEVVGVGDADVFFKISADGVKWPPGLGTRIPGHHAGPWVTSLRDGSLLLTSCSNTLSRSDDCGRTWQAVEPPAWQVGPGKNFTWPAIYQTTDDEIAVMISRRGVRMRFGKFADRSNE